jgi:hypothetical protein
MVNIIWGHSILQARLVTLLQAGLVASLWDILVMYFTILQARLFTAMLVRLVMYFMVLQARMVMQATVGYFILGHS